MARTFCVCIAILLLSVTAFSQATFWNELNGVAGFLDLEEGANGRLFGARGNGVVYMSDDNGLTWTGSLNQTGAISEIAARNEIIFAARLDFNAQNSYQLYLSEDNGGSWTRVTTSVGANRNNFVVSDSGEVFGYFRDTFFGQPFGPFRLTYFTGGQWDFVGSQLPVAANSGTNGISSSIIDHHGNLFAATFQAGVFVSRDRGVTWNQYFGDRGITALAVTPQNHLYLAGNPSSDNGGIHVSKDDGLTWSFLGLPDNFVYSITVDANGVPLAATDDGMYRYNQSLGIWDYTSPLNEQFSATLATRSNTILASSFVSGMFRTDDGGKTWLQSGPRQRDVFAILETSSGKTLAGTLGGRMFASADNGENWFQAPSESVCDNVYALAERNGVVFAGTECGAYRSTDDGSSWASITSDALQGSVVTIATQQDGDVFTGNQFGVQRSTDQGLTWQQAGLSQSSVVSVFAASSGYLFAATAQNGIFLSTDDGTTWLNRGLARDDIQTITANNAGTVFVGAYGGIFRSTNNGASWTERRFTNGYVRSLAFIETKIYAGTSDGVYVSYNNGDSWEALNTSGLFFSNILTLAFDSRGFLLAGTYNGGIYRTAGVLTDVSEQQAIPTTFFLDQNYPNPFNPSTNIRFTIPVTGFTSVKVFNIMGQEVATLVNEVKQPGSYDVAWEAGGKPSGVYYYRLQAETFSETKKMLLLR